VADLYYYLGRLPWYPATDEEPAHYGPPEAVVGMVDLRRLPDQATPAREAEAAFLASAKPLDDSYHALGRGDLRELRVDARLLDLWESVTAYRPAGELLVELLVDQLTAGADPTGDAAVMPLVPTVAGNLDVHLGGHSRIYRRRFRWGADPHTERLRDLLHRQMRAHDQAEAAGREPPGHPRRVLDYWLAKYRLRKSDWRELVPADLRRRQPGPLPHETTITESWNGSDSSTFGVDQTWVHFWSSGSNMDTKDNAGYDDMNPVSTEGLAYISSAALSSDDHYVEHKSKLGRVTEGQYTGACVRFDATNVEFYYQKAKSYNNVYKRVGGADTRIARTNITDFSVDTWYPLKIQADGSTIESWADGGGDASATDTALSGSVRVGVRSKGYGGCYWDDFEAADLATPQTVEPDPVTATWSANAPTLADRLSPDPVSATWSAPAPTLADAISVEAIATTWSAPAPTLADAIEVSPVAAAWSASAPTLAEALTVAPVVATWSLAQPGLPTIVSVDPVSAAWSVITPNTAVTGPYLVVAQQIYLAAAAAGDVHLAGATAAATHQAGAEAAQGVVQ